MKKSIVVTIIILTLLVSMLPVSTAFAKDGGVVTVGVRNRSGGTLSLILTDAKGLYTTLYSFGDPGYYNINVTVGWYDFKASTICGASSGRIFIDKGKAMSFHCEEVKGPVGSAWMIKPGKVAAQ